MKMFTIISAIMFSFAASAAHSGEVSIRSNSGETFYVVLDGAFQNYYPQSKVKVQAAGNNMYNMKVYAADNNFHFDRNIVVKPNKRMKYRIVENFGNFSLQFLSETPINNNYTNSHACCDHQIVQPGFSGNTRPNVRPTRPFEIHESHPSYYNSANLMSNADLDNLKQAIQRESFSDDKLLVATRAAKSKRLRANQIKEIARLFSFSSERLEFAKAAYRNCVDKSNYYQVMEVFTFSSDKEALAAFVDAQ